MGMRDRDGRQAAVAVPTRRSAFDLADPGAPRAYLIGDVAALTGLTPHTLRAWERLDLLAPRRSAGGVRQYSEEDIAFARLIARTLDARRLPRRAVAALIRSGELRPTPDDYEPHPVRATQSARTVQAHPRSHGQTDAESEVSPSTPARAASNRPLLDACARLSNAVASGAEHQQFCELIVREARTIFGLADAVLWLVEPSELPAPHAGNISPPQFGALFAAVADGHPTVLGPAAAAGARGLAVQRAALRLPLANTHLLVVQAIHTGREIVLDGLTPSPRAHPELTLLLPAAALLILPLATAAGRTVGALALREALDSKRFDDALIGEARLFATHVAHLIELTRLRDDMSAARARAEAERARWRAIAEYAPEMIVACDANMRISWSDATYERTFGQPVDRISSANAWPATPGPLLPDESAPFPSEALPLVRALREYRPVHDIEIAHRAPGGAYHLLSWTAAPTQGPRGEVLGAVAIGRDVTDDRRRVARAACLAAVARVAAAAPDPAGVAARLLEALARHSGVPILSASLHLLDPDDGSVTRIGEVHAGTVAKSLAEAPTSDPLADGDHAIWRALATSAQYSATEFPEAGLSDPGRAIPSVVEHHAPSWWQSSGVQAWAIVPLRAGPLLLGALDVAVARPVHWDAGERTWLETCADIMAVALERDRLSAAARRATDELEAIVEGADAGITLVAADGGILRRNAAAAALTGADDDPNALSDSLGPYAPRDPATGAPMPAEARPVARALRGEVVRDALVLTRDSHGRDRLTQTSCTPVRDAGGAVVAAVNYERDATDHMRRTRLYAHLGQALGAILEPGETMRALADALVSIAGIDTVAIYLASPDGDGLDLLWARNYPLDVLETVRHIAPSAPTITALALRTGQPQVLRNWAQAGTDDHHLTRYLARRLDLGSGAAIPMLARGRVMGVLMAGASQPDGFPPEEVGLLLDLAAHAGLAMDNARLYQAAHRSADEQEAIIAAMADPVWVCDADGRLTSVNQAATLLGSTPPAIPGEPPAPGDPASDVSAPRLIWPDGSPVPPRDTPLERARRGEGITGLEAIIQRGAGDDVRLMLSAAPIRDETTGAITGAVSVGHDITILRQLEHAREEFLAIASHELKTPLTSLLGFVQAARRKESRRIQSMLVAGTATDAGAGGTPVGRAPAGGAMGPILDAELLERIERQALRLDRLIGDLLDVARIQQGRMQYRWSEGDVAGAVAEAVDEQRAASPDRQINLLVSDEPLMARLDADRLRQVVTNLLTNALKYSRAEQPVIVEVTRAAIVRGGDRDDPSARSAAAVRVRDTGPGIPPDHRERIFERFYRVPGLQVQSGSGIGLGVGLYVAREVVERHGGRIWVESDHPDETTFAFTVPLVAPDRQL